MLISPPFLPERGSLSEQAWLDLAMAVPPFALAETGAPEGSFPLSLGLAWHNGLHIQAPQPAGTHLPVRAIADGQVVFVHPPTTPVPDIDHPLNYNPFKTDTPRPAWTSDGFLVVRHTSEIGAVGTTPTEVTYFSVCMHLAGIAPNPRSKAPWKMGDAVYRKEALGAPGWIYGHGGQIHFEICCDEANLQRFMPRAPAWSHPLVPEAPTSDGRTDSVFGSVHVYLPAGTPTSTTSPTHHVRVARGASGGASAASDHFPPDTLQQPLWVRITHDRGDAFIDSFDRLGERIGTTHRDPDYEYDLYVTATQRHDSLSDAAKATSSPSGWYELLRFGRNLGSDPLPGDVAHWRRIPTATGTVWADLNAQGTHKFSDADFPAVMGWNCFDDDTSPTDQRCDSLRLRMLVRDPTQPESIRDPQALARRLGNAAVRARLRRAVCRFPSEWERETIVQRYGGLTRDFRPADGDEAGARKWQRFVDHAKAITFDGLPAEFLSADWRFHPREFVGHMRQCGWLSTNEIVSLTRRRTLDARGKNDNSTMISKEVLLNRLSQPTSLRPANLNHAVQAMMRKYLIVSPQRIAHFFGQIAAESGRWEFMTEIGKDSYFFKYEPGTDQGRKLGNTEKGDGLLFKGRGLIQITGRENYANYGAFKGDSGKFLKESEANRVASSASLTCDSAGRHWASKQRYSLQNKKLVPMGRLGINYWADQGISKQNAIEVTKCINPGCMHMEEIRWPCFSHALFSINDDAEQNEFYDPIP